MNKLVIVVFVLSVWLDLALGMTLFRTERQSGGGRGHLKGQGHPGGHKGQSRQPTLEQLTMRFKHHLEQFNNECLGVPASSCEPIEPEIDSILNQIYSGDEDEDQLLAEYISIMQKIGSEDFNVIHCTVRNCFVGKMYTNYKSGQGMPGCDVEEVEQEMEEDTGSFEKDEGHELCEAEAMFEICDLTDDNGVFTVDVDVCASALAQKVMDEQADAAGKKRKLVNQLKRLLTERDDSSDGDDTDTQDEEKKQVDTAEDYPEDSEDVGIVDQNDGKTKDTMIQKSHLKRKNLKRLLKKLVQ